MAAEEREAEHIRRSRPPLVATRASAVAFSRRRETPAKSDSLVERNECPAPCRTRRSQVSPFLTSYHPQVRRHWFPAFLFGVFVLASSTSISSQSMFGRPWTMAASAYACSSTDVQQIDVSPSTPELYSLFECEGGAFNVTWSGAVSTTATIRIGAGTAVSIFGDNTSEDYSNDDLSGTNNGNGSAAVADGDVGPIFYVDGGQLFLEGIAVRKGNASSETTRGGGLYAKDAGVRITSCVFEDNFAKESGGAIHTSQSSVLIFDTTFRRCEAGMAANWSDGAANDEASGEGGGIDAESSNIFVDGCLFEECFAGSKGGAFHEEDGNVSMLNTTFDSNWVGNTNTEDGEGGALSFTTCSRGACSVNDSSFIGNHAAKKGGAVRVATRDTAGSCYVEFHRCVLDKNTAGEGFEDDPQGEGGAFSVGKGSTIHLVDTTVQSCSAGNKGGAIVLASGNGWDVPGGTVVMHNSSFEENWADSDGGGVVYCNEYTTVYVAGAKNRFDRNHCAADGGVFAATVNTQATIEGGHFFNNFGGENGGVFYSKGKVTIEGGQFVGNIAEDRGGVFVGGDEGLYVIDDGTFSENQGGDDGGVGFVTKGSALSVGGGLFRENFADNGGGVFAVEGNTSFEVTGGEFLRNEADFGGFLYREGEGLTSCMDAMVEGNWALDGGAIYALAGADFDWRCDLQRNKALVGPAIYARDGTNMTIRGVTLSDNTVPRGSVVFIVSSFLQTYEVMFADSSGSLDLSAVQIDDNSIYLSEQSLFDGFSGEAIIFSEGILVLDDCDFSKNSAPVLVHAEGPNASTTMRNVVLGDENFSNFSQEASAAGVVPTASSLTNVELNCEDGGENTDAVSSLCSSGSACLDGYVGVYCQCYVSLSSGNETCVSSNPESLILKISAEPNDTYYPNLLEGNLNLILPAEASSSGIGGADGKGVVWNMMVNSSDSTMGGIWTMFPSAGILFPGYSTNVRVVFSPSTSFDGDDEVTFQAYGMGSSIAEEASPLSLVAEAKMSVTFYHCEAGTYWDVDDEEEGCQLCTNADVGDTDGLDCSCPGVSTTTLPLRAGYWRAALDDITIRKCFHQDACVGGTSVNNTNDYCADGYEGPFCAVCSFDYGGGAANQCYRCTTSFKAGTYFVLAVASVLAAVMVGLLTIYLVGGLAAVSSTTRCTQALLRTRGKFKATPVSTISSASCISATAVAERSASPIAVEVSHGRCGALRGMKERELRRSATVVESAREPLSLMSLALSSRPIEERAPRRVPVSRSVTEPLPRVGLLQTDKDSTRTHEPGWIYSEDEEDENTPGTGDGSYFHRETHSTSMAYENPGVAADIGSSGALSRQQNKRMFALQRDTGCSDDGFAPRLGRDAVRSATEDPARGRGGVVTERGDVRAGRRKKAAAVVNVANLRSKIPLSKLKIVIVVWQILGAFAEITQVEWPPIYGKFLSVIRVLTFDLGWIISTSCIHADLDFYDKLLIVTVGPAIILGLLGVTFYVGSRPQLPANGAINLSTHSPQVQRTYDPSSGAARAEGRFTTVPGRQSFRRSQLSGEDRRTEVELSPVMSGDACGSPISPPPVRQLVRSHRQLLSRRSLRGATTPAPSGHTEGLEESRLWWLFARHTTVTLIVLYLIYSQVSTVVFQTFACVPVPEVEKRYLRADFSLECDTPRHRRYEIYAGFMVFVYPLGIPAAFLYFLLRQRSSINPRVKKLDGTPKEFLTREKIEKRKADQTVAPTSFLWGAYYPNRYFYEICECVRRLLLTGLLVFWLPGKPGQVAISCIFAFLSLLMFELLKPHMDRLDTQLYRTGCLVIFFSNFLALTVKAGVADPESSGSALYAAALVMINILLFLSIWWNTWATIGAMFSPTHVQETIIGVDLIQGDQMDKILGDETGQNKKVDEPSKREELEAAPAWDTARSSSTVKAKKLTRAGFPHKAESEWTRNITAVQHERTVTWY